MREWVWMWYVRTAHNCAQSVRINIRKQNTTRNRQPKKFQSHTNFGVPASSPHHHFGSDGHWNEIHHHPSVRSPPYIQRTTLLSQSLHPDFTHTIGTLTVKTNYNLSHTFNTFEYSSYITTTPTSNNHNPISKRPLWFPTEQLIRHSC